MHVHRHFSTLVPVLPRGPTRGTRRNKSSLRINLSCDRQDEGPRRQRCANKDEASQRCFKNKRGDLPDGVDAAGPGSAGKYIDWKEEHCKHIDYSLPWYLHSTDDPKAFIAYLQQLSENVDSVLDAATGQARDLLIDFMMKLDAARARASRQLLLNGIAAQATTMLHNLRKQNEADQCFREEATPSDKKTTVGRTAQVDRATRVGLSGSSRHYISCWAYSIRLTFLTQKRGLVYAAIGNT